MPFCQEKNLKATLFVIFGAETGAETRFKRSLCWTGQLQGSMLTGSSWNYRPSLHLYSKMVYLSNAPKEMYCCWLNPIDPLAMRFHNSTTFLQHSPQSSSSGPASNRSSFLHRNANRPGNQLPVAPASHVDPRVFMDDISSCLSTNPYTSWRGRWKDMHFTTHRLAISRTCRKSVKMGKTKKWMSLHQEIGPCFSRGVS